MEEYKSPTAPLLSEPPGARGDIGKWAAGLIAVLAIGGATWWLLPRCEGSCVLMHQRVFIDTVQLQLIRLHRQTGKLEQVDEKLSAPRSPQISASYLAANGTLMLANEVAGTVFMIEPVITADGKLQWRCRLWPARFDEALWCKGVVEGPAPASIAALPP